MARKNARSRRRKTARKKKPSPHIVAEVHTRIHGRPAVIRVYEKNWKYKSNLVATVRVGADKMGYKSPSSQKRKSGGKSNGKKKKR